MAPSCTATPLWPRLLAASEGDSPQFCVGAGGRTGLRGSEKRGREEVGERPAKASGRQGVPSRGWEGPRVGCVNVWGA